MLLWCWLLAFAVRTSSPIPDAATTTADPNWISKIASNFSEVNSTASPNATDRSNTPSELNTTPEATAPSTTPCPVSETPSCPNVMSVNLDGFSGQTCCRPFLSPNETDNKWLKEVSKEKMEESCKLYREMSDCRRKCALQALICGNEGMQIDKNIVSETFDEFSAALICLQNNLATYKPINSTQVNDLSVTERKMFDKLCPKEMENVRGFKEYNGKRCAVYLKLANCFDTSFNNLCSQSGRLLFWTKYTKWFMTSAVGIKWPVDVNSTASFVLNEPDCIELLNVMANMTAPPVKLHAPNSIAYSLETMIVGMSFALLFARWNL